MYRRIFTAVLAGLIAIGLLTMLGAEGIVRPQRHTVTQVR